MNSQTHTLKYKEMGLYTTELIEKSINFCSNKLGVSVQNWKHGKPEHWGTNKFALLQWNDGICTISLNTVFPNSHAGGCCVGFPPIFESTLHEKNCLYIGPLDEEEYWIFKWTIDKEGKDGHISINPNYFK